MKDRICQKTLGASAQISGIALHTGRRVRMAMHPAAVGTGIRFRRMDLEGRPEVAPLLENVTATRRGTTITSGAASVHTVEHVLAALMAFGIDNVLIDLEGPEPPVGDGSSAPFVEMLRQTGSIVQEAPRRFLRLETPVFLEDGETRLAIVPDEQFRMSCTVKYNATPLDCQYQSLPVNEETFVNQICRARTFCLFEEIEALIKANLIVGGSLDNSVVIKGDAIISRDGMRYPDELVRHKILDIIGDFSLLGRPLRAHIIAVKPGHGVNVAAALKVRAACREE